MHVYVPSVLCISRFITKVLCLHMHVEMITEKGAKEICIQRIHIRKYLVAYVLCNLDNICICYVMYANVHKINEKIK